MQQCIHPQGDVHTPYGATEALPVASISAREVLDETAARTRQGAGVCVGRPFPGVAWKVIRVVEGPIRSAAQFEELPSGDPMAPIGELIVRSPAVTREYVCGAAANEMAKIPDPGGAWHRMGDVGYIDGRGQFWFCGRLAHRVLTPQGPMYPVRCEAVFNEHPQVFRSALVGVGAAGRQRPVLVIEPVEGRMPRGGQAAARFLAEIRELGQRNPLTAAIQDFLFHPAFPVDVRHNVKISREKLAVWAAARLAASR
jgi:acyl-CoA synthetase (AMP-forming)/AMP-acid ligase II